jgi:hypothetical protein
MYVCGTPNEEKTSEVAERKINQGKENPENVRRPLNVRQVKDVL